MCSFIVEGIFESWYRPTTFAVYIRFNHPLRLKRCAGVKCMDGQGGGAVME
jgi:hypothetical protein